MTDNGLDGTMYKYTWYSFMKVPGWASVVRGAGFKPVAA